MTPEEFQKLPLMPLGDTYGNAPTGLDPIQQFFLPYVEYYHLGLWFIFFSTLSFMVINYIGRPLLEEGHKAAAPSLTPQGSKFKNLYHKVFSIDEIEKDLVVRLFGYAILIGFLASFRSWEGSLGTTIHADQLCWPFLQNCDSWAFMTGRPYGYDQNAFFMIMFGLIVLSAYYLSVGHYMAAHVCILILFLWKLYITSLSYYYNANYDYYHTAFCIIFLFMPHKRFFGSLCVVFFYFLSTATKIHESWSLGTYFTSMKTGLPIFPDSTTMIWTNLVIFMEMVGAWFLFSRHKILQRTVFFFFCIFHLYSGLLVGYHYPTIVMPSLIVFFGPLYKPFDMVPLDRKAVLGWLFMLSLLGAQMISHFIPGDEKLTLEGNFYGLYMFEANHQCRVIVKDEQGNIVREEISTSARNRCDPYRYMHIGQKMMCGQGENSPKFSATLDHSINGGPFYRIVDVDDACALTYKPFSKNDWIKTEKTAEPVGRPHKNLYY